MNNYTNQYEDDFDIQIIIASGYKDIERAILGFATACACVTSGAKVVVFLSMEGAVFAAETEGKAVLVNNFETIHDYLDILQSEGVQIEVCTACAENFTPTKERVGRQKKLREGMIYAGLSTAAIRSIKTQTIVF